MRMLPTFRESNPRLTNERSLTQSIFGMMAIGSLLLSTSASAEPELIPINLVAVRPTDGATIPATPDIWIAVDGDAGGIYATFVDEAGNVIATANATQRLSPVPFDASIWSVTPDIPLPAGWTVELELANFGETRFSYVVEETPRPDVVLPALQVGDIEILLDGGELVVQFTVGLEDGDVLDGALDDVQGFIIGKSIDVGDRVRTSTVLIPHPSLLGRSDGVRATLSQRLGDEKPPEVCVSLGAYTISNIEIPASLVPAEMDCYAIDVDGALWDALVAKREADRLLFAAEPDPLPSFGLNFGCSQSGGAASFPIALLGLLCLGFARLRRG